MKATQLQKSNADKASQHYRKSFEKFNNEANCSGWEQAAQSVGVTKFMKVIGIIHWLGVTNQNVTPQQSRGRQSQVTSPRKAKVQNLKNRNKKGRLWAITSPNWWGRCWSIYTTSGCSKCLLQEVWESQGHPNCRLWSHNNNWILDLQLQISRLNFLYFPMNKKSQQAEKWTGVFLNIYCTETLEVIQTFSFGANNKHVHSIHAHDPDFISSTL